MTKPQLLFDSNAIYKLIREYPENALDKLLENTTIYLAYYELGNALWRECLLMKRINIEEAEKSLGLMYAILERMQVSSLDNDTGEILGYRLTSIFTLVTRTAHTNTEVASRRRRRYSEFISSASLV